jgi:hypothetical protein
MKGKKQSREAAKPFRGNENSKTDMKTKNSIELSPKVVARGNLATRTATSLVLATTTMSAVAGDGGKLVAREDSNAIRPFRVNVPKTALTELRRRLVATRWPTKELVKDRSQGVQLAKLKELVRYWVKAYDWRKVEKKLNAFPQFVTKIDGVDIHFIHVKSHHPKALALIITHGWP